MAESIVALSQVQPGRSKRKLFRLQLSARARFSLAIALMLSIGSLVYDHSMANPSLKLEDLPLLPVADYRRLLVIAPHPDDETLGAGGVIQAAIAAGAAVRVVVVTNGDGQVAGPVALRGEVVPRAKSYITDGEVRQAETLAAVQALGLSSESAVFLGYPDRALGRLWLDDWNTKCPLRAAYTRAARSPYPNTFNPIARYCGRDLLGDLLSVIQEFEPDAVFLPHPNDQNPDHWATSNFSRMAVALVASSRPEYQPALWGYLVHYGYYPQHRGLRPDDVLLPPRPLSGDSSQWVRLDLPQSQVATKALALEAHASQQRLLGSFLPSFARRDEIFVHLPVFDISISANRRGLLDTVGPRLFHEPAKESTRRLVGGSADLIGLQIEPGSDSIAVMALMRGRLVPGLRYEILVKSPDGATQRLSWPGSAERSSAASFTARLDEAAFAASPVLGVAAQVSRGLNLDSTSWHFVRWANPSVQELDNVFPTIGVAPGQEWP